MLFLSPAMVEWAKRLLTVCGVAAGVAGVALGLLVTFQEKLIYIPRIPGMPALTHDEPKDYGLDAEEVILEAADGTKLCAWYLYPQGWTVKQRRAHPTIIFLQENAGSMAMRLSFIAAMLRYLQCSVLAPSYRGYRLNEKLVSGGAPNEGGLKQDAQAALDYLLTRPDVDPSQVGVMGKSLGGATAIHLAAANPGKIRSLVVENTFTSIEDVAHKVMPLLKYIIGRNKPLNFLDEMLPPAQMQELYTIAKQAGAKNVTWVDFADAHHMDAYMVAHNYWPALMHFYKTHHKGGAQTGSDSEDSTGGFEDVGSEPAVQAMLRAGRKRGDMSASAEGVHARQYAQ